MLDSLALLKTLKSEGFYKDLINQLNRDFLRAGTGEEFSLDAEPKVLVRNLQAVLYDLIITDFESYLTLLYAIDVSEAKIKALPVMQVHELAVAVCSLILEREIAKISFKNKNE